MSPAEKSLSLRRDVLPLSGLPAHLHLSVEEEGDRFHTTRRPARFFTSDESFRDTGETKRPHPLHRRAADLERRRGDYDNYGSPFIIKFWPGISGQASERARERMMRPPERKAGRKRENVADSIQPALMQWGATTQHNGNKR